MNRAERRRAAKEAGKQMEKQSKTAKALKVTYDEVMEIKRDATEEAVQVAFELMLAIPVMVLHDKYSLLMKRTVDGKSREERFVDMCLDIYECYKEDRIEIADLRRVLKEEGGLEFEGLLQKNSDRNRPVV